MIPETTELRRQRDSEAESEYRKTVGMLLGGIAAHALEGEDGDLERFRVEMDTEKRLMEEAPLSQFSVVAGGALQAMSDYQLRNSDLARRRNVELQHVIGMLAQALTDIGSPSGHCLNELQELGKSGNIPSTLKEIQLLKPRLADCLESIRVDSLRKQTELQQQLDESLARMGAFVLAHDMDAATGLPGKVEAEKAIREAIESPQGKYLLVAVCNRVQAVNTRFGYAVGDVVLGAISEHFRKHLPPRDGLYRWHGPSVVGILERQDRIEQIRTELRRFADARLEKTVEVGKRTVLIPIAATWCLYPITAPFDVLLKKVETFAAGQAPRD